MEPSAKQALLAAASDLRYLLGHGYSREKVLVLVGDRHGLSAAQRQMLRRGVLSPQRASVRKERRLDLSRAAGCMVGLDGHNLLITLETALRGEVLVLADDGWVRDISQVGRNHKPGPLTSQAARMIVEALAGAGAAGGLIWLDAPLPKSGELAREFGLLLQEYGLKGEAGAVPVPEKNLLPHEGPVASSDGAVIDVVEQPMDLAGDIIRNMEPMPEMESLI